MIDYLRKRFTWAVYYTVVYQFYLPTARSFIKKALSARRPRGYNKIA